MTLVADLTFPAEDCALRGVFQADPDLCIQLHHLVRADHQCQAYLWLPDAAVPTLEQTIQETTRLEDSTIHDRRNSDALARVAWAADSTSALSVLARTAGEILAGQATADGWSLQLRVSDHEVLAACYTRCQKAGLTTWVDGIYTNSANRLSDDQLRALDQSTNGAE